jgi:hypothetical protein
VDGSRFGRCLSLSIAKRAADIRRQSKRSWGEQTKAMVKERTLVKEIFSATTESLRSVEDATMRDIRQRVDIAPENRARIDFYTPLLLCSSA